MIKGNEDYYFNNSLEKTCFSPINYQRNRFPQDLILRMPFYEPMEKKQDSINITDQLVDQLGIDKILLVQNSGIPVSAYGLDIENKDEVDRFIIISALIKAVRGFFEISDCARIDTLRIDDLRNEDGKLILEIGSEWEDFQENGELKWRIYNNFSFLIRDPAKSEIQSQILRKAFKDIVKEFNTQHPELIDNVGSIDIDAYSGYINEFLEHSMQDVKTSELKEYLVTEDEVIKLFEYKKVGNDLSIKSNNGKLLVLKENSLVDQETNESLDLHSGKLLQPYEVGSEEHEGGFTYFNDIPTAEYCPCSLFENLPMYLHELAPVYHSISNEVYGTYFPNNMNSADLTSSIGIIDGRVRFLLTVCQEGENEYVGSMLRITQHDDSNLLSKMTKYVKNKYRYVMGKDLVREIHRSNSFLNH